MKLLILLVLGALGLGGLGLVPGASDASAPSRAATECDVSVECTPQGTCLIVCYDENGQECCREEIDCDGPCDQPCDSPCVAAPSCAPGR